MGRLKTTKDRLADPKALDPNNCRQPTHLLHELCLRMKDRDYKYNLQSTVSFLPKYKKKYFA